MWLSANSHNFCHRNLKNNHRDFILQLQNSVKALHGQVKTAAHNILKVFFYLSKKISLDISCELSARQTIYMKNQDFFLLGRQSTCNITPFFLLSMQLT